MNRTAIARGSRIVALLLSLLVSLAYAQERLNHLAVNGEILDAAGPYYFLDHGDSQNAYARAVPFAEAMGLRVAFDAGRQALVFTDGVVRAEFEATDDVARGLVKRDGALRVDGEGRSSPMAILVDGSSYVAIGPLVAAFGGDSPWNADVRVISVKIADRSVPPLTPPRLGLTDGVSRVALDLPTGRAYRVAVDGSTLALIVPGMRAPSGAVAVDNDPNLRGVRFGEVEGETALLVSASHPLGRDGTGFRLGHLERGDHDIVYVDVAPEMQGGAVGGAPQGLSAAAPALTEPTRHVVIDAGHGGHDPGTSHYAVEKEVVLAIALQVKRRLESEGVEVTLTRHDDTFVELEDRADFATPEHNLFVSIHANAAPDSDARGVETWVFGRPLDPSLIHLAIEENGGGELGRARTDALLDNSSITSEILTESQLAYSTNLADIVQRRLVDGTGAHDRGVRKNAFLVLRRARTPAILVEVGFVTNREEGELLDTASYRTKLAEALAEGILDFLDSGGALAER